MGAGLGSGPLHHRAAGRGLAGAVAAARPARPQQPDRVTYVRTEVTPPAGTLRRATAYVSAAHTYRMYVDGVPVDAWPSFSYPDEQYARAVDLTGALAGGRTSAIGLLHRWYGPGQGRPASAPGSCSSCPSGTTTAARTWSCPMRAGASSRPNGCRRPSATPTGATSWSGSTGGTIPRGGRAPATTTAPGRASRLSARPARRPSPGPTRNGRRSGSRPVLPVSLHTRRGRCRRGGLRRRLPGPAAD